MKCTHCGSEIAQRPSRDPWCMYKLENDVVINMLFDPNNIPDGWYDSPRAARLGVHDPVPPVDITVISATAEVVLEEKPAANVVAVSTEEKPKRTRRNKAQMEADKLAEEAAKLGESDGDSSGHNQQCG